MDHRRELGHRARIGAGAGFARDRFEITFPRRFTWTLKLLRLLPYRLYFAVTRRRTGA